MGYLLLKCIIIISLVIIYVPLFIWTFRYFYYLISAAIRVEVFKDQSISEKGRDFIYGPIFPYKTIITRIKTRINRKDKTKHKTTSDNDTYLS